MSVAYGKLYMKDQNGNIVQIIPDTAAIHGQYQGATSIRTNFFAAMERGRK